MKILFHHRIASRDGQAVHMEELIAALHAQGHETILVGPAGFHQTAFGGSAGIVDRIKRAIPAWGFEVLELGYNIPAFFRLAAAIRRHRPDVIYERFSLFLLAGVWAQRLSRLPLLMEVNSPLFEERARNDGLRLHALGRWAQRVLWTRADAVLPVTQVLADTIRAYGVSPQQIAVIPNGIDLGRFGAPLDTDAAKQALGLTGRTVIGFTGFIRGWNAIDRIIDFVAEHGAALNLHLLVVGDGPAHAPLLDHARARGVPDRLTITGVVPRDSIAQHVAAFDIAVIPGLTPYSSPLKLFEYMALRRAVVAPDTANIREILTDGVDATLFDLSDPGRFENALLRLCRDPAMRMRTGKAARATIDERGLTWARNATRVAAIAHAAIETRTPEALHAVR